MLLTPLAKTQSLSASNKGLAWFEWLGLAVIFSTGLLCYLMPTVGWFQQMPGDLVDARFNSIVLEHLYQWVTGQVSSLWSPHYFFPFKGVLAFSDNHFGSAASYIVARVAGFTREDAFLLWFITGNLLNFWVCWWALRGLGFSVLASAIGAFVFAFALPVLHKENHAQLVYRFATPLAFGAWYRALSSFRLIDLAKTGLWCAMQTLCSIYLGLFLVCLLSAMFVAYVFCRLLSTRPQVPVNPPPRWIITIAWFVLAALAVCAAALVLREYQKIALMYHFSRTLEDIKPMLPRPASYLVGDGSRLTGWIGQYFTDVPMRHEQQLFLGIGPLLLGLAGLTYCWLKKIRPDTWGAILLVGRVSSITLATLFFLTLSIDGHTLYLTAIEKLPALSSIRAVSRVVLVMMMPVAVLVALPMQALIQSRGPQLAKIILASFVGLVATGEASHYNFVHVAKQDWLNRGRHLSALISQPLESDNILYVTADREETYFLTEVDAVIYAQDHHLRTINGYSGNIPPGYRYPDPCLPPSTRIDGYFAYFLPDDERRKSLNDQVKLVSSSVCAPSEGVK
jgi:hypothetical protein